MDGFKGSSQRTVKCEVSSKKNHLLSLFKHFEVTISDKKKKYVDKLQSLISAWEQIGTFIAETSSESPQPEFDSLFLHTLRQLLRADWKNASKAIKTHLSTTLTRIIADLTSGERFLSILPQCRVLESVINDPWDHTTLKKIFQDEIVDIDELIDYFHFENGKVIVIRLEILLESKCEEFASRLSKACLMTFNLTDPLELELNQDEVDYITDIYLCCLFKAKNTKDIIDEVKTLDINDGLHLLQRYNLQEGVGNKFNENCREARVWKNSKRVMELISSTLLVNAVLQDNFASSDIDILHGLIREWASVHTSSASDAFSPVPSEMIWKCVLVARCSMCIYPFCSFLIECDGKQHDLNQVLRCLIRAINQNMNEIETLRVGRNNEKIKFAHDLLAKGFLLTAELFREYRNIFRECLLTAFSLTPTRERLQRLEDFVNDEMNAPKTLATDAEIKIKTQPDVDNFEDQKPATRNNEAAVTRSSSASIVSESVSKKRIKKEPNTAVEGENDDQVEEDSALNTSSGSLNETIKGAASAYISEVESMQIEDSLKTDLNAILRHQRHHTLTWDFEWPVLKVNCEKYHEMFEKRGFDEVELKYLELDYNQFKNHPIEIDDSAGIEKGYEHFITNDIEESDEEFGYSGKVGYSSDDSYYDEDYGRKKRKKSRNRYDDDFDWSHRMTQKKRKPKVKIESFDTLDEHSADGLPNGDARGAKNSARNLPNKRKLRSRLRDNKSCSDSETNADSQSENQPPEEEKNDLLVESVLSGCSAKTSTKNLRLLRQFRISLSKPLISDENITNIAQRSSEDTITRRSNAMANSNYEKTTDLVYVDGDSVRLVICIPKCDGYPYFNNVQMLDAFIETRKSMAKKITPLEEPAPPEKSITKADTSAVIDQPDTTDDTKKGSSDGSRDSVSKGKVKYKYPSRTSVHARRFWMNRHFRKKLFNASLVRSKQTSDGIDDLISEIFPEFSSNGSWQTNGNLEDTFFEPPPPPPVVAPCPAPPPTLSEFLDTTLDSTLGPTSSTEATFVSSTVELASVALPINPVADGSSPPSCNELTPLQPASSPPMVRVFSSYLNSSIDSIDSMYSYPSNIGHSHSNVQQSLTSDELTAYELSSAEFLDISAPAEPSYSGYSDFQQHIPDDVYSMSVSSTYDAVAVPSAALSPLLENDVPTPTVHSNDGANLTLVTQIPTPNSKLREALQKEKWGMDFTVCLRDIAQTKKPSPPEEPDDSAAVNQILDEYRDTMDKHPELGHVPARRKRSQDPSSGTNPAKRPRRAKKDSVVAPLNQDYSLSTPNQVQVPLAVVIPPTNHVQVPSQLLQQTPPSSDGQVMPSEQMNNVYESLSSDGTVELPSCAATDISSQTYGDVISCKDEVIVNVSTYDTDVSSQAVNTSDGVAPVPLPSYWPNDTNLMSLDEANAPVQADNDCGDLKAPFLIATVCNDNSTDSTDPAVFISIPEYECSESFLGNHFSPNEGTQLLVSSDGLFSKNQTDDAAADTQSVQYTSSSVAPKPDSSATTENGVILNIENVLCDSEYSAEANNYGT